MESNEIDKLQDAKNLEFYKQAVRWYYETSMAYDKNVIVVSIVLVYVMIAYFVPHIKNWYDFLIFSIALFSFIFSTCISLVILDTNKNYLIAMVSENKTKLDTLTKMFNKLDLLSRYSFIIGMVSFVILAITDTAMKLIK